MSNTAQYSTASCTHCTLTVTCGKGGNLVVQPGEADSLISARPCFRWAEEARPQLQRPDPEQVRQSSYHLISEILFIREILLCCYLTCFYLWLHFVQVFTKLFFIDRDTSALSLWSRGCTDIVCCILFIVAIVAYFAVGILGKETVPYGNTDPIRKPLCNCCCVFLCSQPGPRVTPGRWSTPQIVEDSSVDKLAARCSELLSSTSLWLVEMHIFSLSLFCVCLCFNRNKPLLFYFNIMKCASPMVLLEFQCPTPQVWTPLSMFLHFIFCSSFTLLFVCGHLVMILPENSVLTGWESHLFDLRVAVNANCIR